MVLVRLPMPILAGQVDGVDGVDLDVVLGDVALGSGVQMVAQLLVVPLAVDQEHAAGLHVADDGEALGDVGRARGRPRSQPC